MNLALYDKWMLQASKTQPLRQHWANGPARQVQAPKVLPATIVLRKTKS